MSDKNSIPPTPQEIGHRILANIDQVRGYLDVLQDEINNPAKSGKGGSVSEWRIHTKKLDASLSELKEILTRQEGGASK